jgi:hypothetical protein
MYSNSVIPKIMDRNIFVEIWGFSQLRLNVVVVFFSFPSIRRCSMCFFIIAAKSVINKLQTQKRLNVSNTNKKRTCLSERKASNHKYSSLYMKKYFYLFSFIDFSFGASFSLSSSCVKGDMNCLKVTSKEEMH